MSRHRRRTPIRYRLVLGIVATLGPTLAAVVPGAAAERIGLGAAEAFGVLAGTGITNTGLTVVNGDIGSCPTLAITGFEPPGVVHGTIHAGGPVACQAQSDLTTAYDATVAVPATTTYLGPTDVGGLTLTTGVFRSPTSLGIGGTVTLDAGGDPNALFTFQAGTTLITSANSTVLLINGAQACNVSWQVGNFATLGLGSTFKGSILAYTTITAGAGIDVEGRLLARGGAVTLDSDTITIPVCAAGSLTLSQTPTAGTPLVEGSAVAMPVTTVTDNRTGITRNWTVTATASDLVTTGGAVIPASDIALDYESGGFTTGSGTPGDSGLVSMEGASLGSVYTYTPTAELAPQDNPAAGSYTGTVTQTVV